MQLGGKKILVKLVLNLKKKEILVSDLPSFLKAQLVIMEYIETSNINPKLFQLAFAYCWRVETYINAPQCSVGQ